MTSYTFTSQIYGAVDQLTPEEARVLAQCTNDALMNRSEFFSKPPVMLFE